MLIFQELSVTFGFGTEIEKEQFEARAGQESLMWEVVYNHFLITTCCIKKSRSKFYD
jgi:hypothetical protein